VGIFFNPKAAEAGVRCFQFYIRAKAALVQKSNKIESECAASRPRPV